MTVAREHSAEAAAKAGPAAASARAWSPFRHSAFAVLWTATLVSNVGTWMHDVGAGWLMTSLSPSPLMVAFVQAETMLPPAGRRARQRRVQHQPRRRPGPWAA